MRKQLDSWNEVIKIIAEVPLFAGFPTEILHQLAKIIQKQKYDKYSAIINEGDLGEKVFIIVDGLVKIIKKDIHRRETLLTTAGQGEIVGEMSILDGSTRSADVIALTDVLTFTIDRDDFLEFLEKHPEATLKLLQTMSMRVRITNELVVEQRAREIQLKYMGEHDCLTGLFNRTLFQEEMKHTEIEEFNPTGLIICDLDGLKIVNDNYGHQAGDALIVAAAQIIKKSFRENDVIARIGGDEIAVLMYNTSQAVLEDGCRHIRENVADFNQSNPINKLGISIGYAISYTTLSADELYKRADLSMYEDKASKRKT